MKVESELNDLRQDDGIEKIELLKDKSKTQRDQGKIDDPNVEFLKDDIVSTVEAMLIDRLYDKILIKITQSNMFESISRQIESNFSNKFHQIQGDLKILKERI